MQQHDEAEDGRQRAHVAAAEAVDVVGPDVAPSVALRAAVLGEAAAVVGLRRWSVSTVMCSSLQTVAVGGVLGDAEVSRSGRR